MNAFGKLFCVQIFGESHGESVGLVIDGCPAGLPLSVEDFIVDTERRKGGVQKGTTPRKEDDLPIFKNWIIKWIERKIPIENKLREHSFHSSACWNFKIGCDTFGNCVFDSHLEWLLMIFVIFVVDEE